MNLQEIYDYLAAKSSAMNGRVNVVNEGRHVKIMIDLPKLGTHIFYLSLHKEPDSKVLDSHYEKALRALHANNSP